MSEKSGRLKNKIDPNRIEKFAKITQKVIEFSAIYEEISTCDNWNDCKYSQFKCFKNADGRDLMGTVICSKPMKKEENIFCRNSEIKELFFMEDGTFKVFLKKTTWSNLLNQENKHFREFASDQDVSCFGYDEIIENISKKMIEGLERSGRLSKAETARLERLKKSHENTHR